MFERAVPPRLSYAEARQSFRDGYLEAIHVARLDVPWDVPDRLLSGEVKSASRLRELAQHQDLPIGNLSTADWGTLSPEPEMARGFRWALSGRVSAARARSVRAHLERLRPDAAELRRNYHRDRRRASAWTRIVFPEPPEPNSTADIQLGPHARLRWGAFTARGTLSLQATGPPPLAPEIWPVLPVSPPVLVWFDQETERVAMCSEKDGRWLVLHVPSQTVLYEASEASFEEQLRNRHLRDR